jgi:hypothetical protein
MNEQERQSGSQPADGSFSTAESDAACDGPEHENPSSTDSHRSFHWRKYSYWERLSRKDQVLVLVFGVIIIVTLAFIVISLWSLF